MDSELAAGEWGLDVSGNQWYYSTNGTTVTAFTGGLTQEQVEDFIGAMVASNTETGIAVTYDDAAAKLNFVVSTLDALPAPVADVSMGGHKITNVTDPSSAQDAATKAYVDSAVTGLLDYKGNIDASTNPNYPSASKGDVYFVSVAGKVGGASGVTVAVGDAVVAKADNAGGTEASVGASWFVMEKNLDGALLSANNLSDVASAATAATNLGVGTGDSPQFAAVNIGHATDTTITRVSAGVIAVEGSTVLVSGGALGTPSSATLTNATGLPATGIGSGDIATARMQTNIVAAINAAAGTQTAGTIDCGTL